MEVSLTLSIIGLCGSGKTTIVKSLLNSHDQIFPTAGFQINYVSSNLKPILVYDCSGEPRNIANWNMFSNLADSVVFVIDSNEKQSFSISKKYLFRFLQNNRSMKYLLHQNRKKNLCIMLNKSDIKQRPPRQVVYKALQVQKIQKYVSKLYVKQTSAYNKDGIQECLEWLIKC